TIQCASNQKQLAVAMFVYTQQNDDHYAPTWVWYPPLTPSSPPLTWAGVLWGQGVLGSPLILGCPSFDEVSPIGLMSQVPLNADPDFWLFTRPHIGYNAYNIGSRVREEGINGYLKYNRVQDVLKPTETILYTDTRATDSPGQVLGHYAAYDFNATASGFFLDAVRHRMALNIAWNDGHVTTTPITDPNDPYADITSVFDTENNWDRR
ncbi:MAG TPA: hypothetical protein VF184_00135, partial [Phycisphaeraceae bacterium]